MPARAISSATISFGLVTIPIKLYSASKPKAGVSFHLLHAPCGTRLRQQYFCPTDNEIVGRDQIVKGYELARGRYVTFTDEELRALEERATGSVDIVEFVPLAHIDPIYFDRAYYLGPDKGGERPYALLSRAMEETAKAALARYAARGKQYLVLVRPFDAGLVMQQLFYADEIRPFSEVPKGEPEVRESELSLAKQLVGQITVDAFHPEAFADEVRGRMLEAVRKKLEGEEITVARAEAPRAQIIDLMEALKASLTEGQQPATATQHAAGSKKPPKRVTRAGAKRTRAPQRSSKTRQ